MFNPRDKDPVDYERSIRSVFVGNIPYEATEENLKDIFNEVGIVVSFRLVFDRESGKPKGYGFAEYENQETAMSAMRNLNGRELHGRNLRVDHATSEKNRTQFQEDIANFRATGPPVESDYGEPTAPQDAPEAISKAVASLPPEQMFELMKQMKQCIQNNPVEARNMLLQNPQLAYALLQAQVVMRIVDPEIAMKMLHRQNPITPLIPAGAGEGGPGPADPRSNGGGPLPGLGGDRPPMKQEPPFDMKMEIPIDNPGPGHPRGGPPDHRFPPRRNDIPGIDRVPVDHGGPGDVPMDRRGAPHMNPRHSNSPDRFPPRNQDRDDGFPDKRGGNRGSLDRDSRGGPPMRGGPMDRPPMDRDGRGGPPGPMMNRGPPGGPGMPPMDRGPNRGGPPMDRGPMGHGPPPPGSRNSPMDMGRGPPPGGRHMPPFEPGRSPHDRMDGRRGAPPPPPGRPSPGPSGGPVVPDGGPGDEQDQEKAQLIMQVLQLTPEQIKMLPEEQRKSILALKDQLGRQ